MIVIYGKDMIAHIFRYYINSFKNGSIKKLVIRNYVCFGKDHLLGFFYAVV